MSPLRVDFDSAGSQDPDGGELTFAWEFGDGSTWTPVATRANPAHVYPSVDFTSQCTFVSALDDVDPPIPMGLGNLSPEVLRDGHWPASGATDPQLQFDTFHIDAAGMPDKGAQDWIGWTFPEQREVVSVVFQTGWIQPESGGWFEGLGVELLSSDSGQWRAVSSQEFLPVHQEMDDPSFTVHQILFEPTVARGVRLVGAPGGVDQFVSAAEFLVFVSPLNGSEPASFEAELTVTDPVGLEGSAQYLVHTNNSEPYVLIVSPVDGATYPVNMNSFLQLEAAVNDAEQGTEGLHCSWQLSLLHDNHLHPESAIEGCLADFTLVPHEELGGDTVYWVIELTVTDAQGAETKRTAYVYPEGDCNLNGVADSIEIAENSSLDLSLDGVLDSCQQLMASPLELSVSAGGVQDFTLNAGAQHANSLYFLLGSASGFAPGFPVISGINLPLVADAYFLYTLEHANKPPLHGSFGQLDAAGQATASLSVNAGLSFGLTGLVLRHAYVILDPVTLLATDASNAAMVRLVQ